MIKVQRFDTGAVTVLRLNGDIDAGGVNDLRQHLLDCLKERRHNVVVNMAEVGLISYMGLGVLVERLQLFRAAGGDLKLACVNTYGDHLFRLVGITSLFERYENEQQAVRVYLEAA